MSVIAAIAAGEHLAAYGLLRRGSGVLERLGLVQSITLIGPCRIPGRLYDLGGAPGLVTGDGEVKGELVRVKDAAAGVALDRFEDFDPAEPASSGYARRRIRLIEPALEAWVYVWTKPVAEEERIPSGDWLAHLGRPRAEG